jgi:hypothetical protein
MNGGKPASGAQASLPADDGSLEALDFTNCAYHATAAGRMTAFPTKLAAAGMDRYHCRVFLQAQRCQNHLRQRVGLPLDFGYEIRPPAHAGGSDKHNYTSLLVTANGDEHLFYQAGRHSSQAASSGRS